MLRCTVCAKSRAFGWFFGTLQHFTGNARRSLLGCVGHDAELMLGIVGSVGWPKPQATLGKLSNATPFAGYDFEHFPNVLLSRFVTLTSY